jgi:uncharacterized OB-fold protein
MSSTEGAVSPKAVPVPTPDTERYWAGTARGELWVQRCDACGRSFFYPRNGCPHCSSLDVTWERVSGRARLHTYVISHRHAPGFAHGVPYAIAVVELEEGPRMMSNIIGIDNIPEQLELDMELVVDFEPRGDQMVPVFRPAKGAP